MSEKENSKAKCPKCGSTQIEIIHETTQKGKTKGFGWIKGCFMTLIIGPFGWLCGLCGMGKGKFKGKTEAKRMCVKCGHKF